MVRTNATTGDRVKLSFVRCVAFLSVLPFSYHLMTAWTHFLAALVLALAWYRYGVIILHKCGFDRLIFGMELIHGCDKTFLVWGVDQSPIVGTCIKMEKPDDMDLFRRKVLNHFLQFSRLKSQLVVLGTTYFFRELTERRVVNRLVEIWPDSMDEKEV